MHGNPDGTGLAPLISTGISGLDEVLLGGLRPNRLYLLEGDPGAGKTTVALQFLLAGVRAGERCLFVTLSESADELRASATSHGWSLEGIDIFEISASEEKLASDARYTMFHPSEVELTETVKTVLAEASRLKPARLVFDSLSELRLLAEDPLRYRRQILALKHHFAAAQCTVLVVDDRTGNARDMHLHSIAHGALCLERQTTDYGTLRRQLEVRKMRGAPSAKVCTTSRSATGHPGVPAPHRRRVSRAARARGLRAACPRWTRCWGAASTRGTSALVIGTGGQREVDGRHAVRAAAPARGESQLRRSCSTRPVDLVRRALRGTWRWTCAPPSAGGRRRSGRWIRPS